jgi:hypothetical protein
MALAWLMPQFPSGHPAIIQNRQDNQPVPGGAGGRAERRSLLRF